MGTPASRSFSETKTRQNTQKPQLFSTKSDRHSLLGLAIECQLAIEIMRDIDALVSDPFTRHCKSLDPRSLFLQEKKK